jgi:hypothetical protein
MGDTGLSTQEYTRISRLAGFAAVAQGGSTIRRGVDHQQAPHNGIPVTVYAIFRVQMPSPREKYDVCEISVGNGTIEPTGKTWQGSSIEEARGFVPVSHQLQFPATVNDPDTLVETWA